MRDYACLGNDAVVKGVARLTSGLDRLNLIPLKEGEKPFGKKWDGEKFIDVPKEPKPPLYSGSNFMEALGDEINRQLIEATDSQVKVIVKRFDAVISEGKPIKSDHPQAQIDFDYLVACADVPSFTADTKAALCQPVIS